MSGAGAGFDAARAMEALGSRGFAGGGDAVSLSREKPVLVVFLRHFGCTFCREAAKDVADGRGAIEEKAALVFVHMGSGAQGDAFFERYGLSDVRHVSDPKGELYEAFGLGRGSLGQLFGLPVWVRGFKAGVVDGHWVGKLVGDGFRMPGVFRIEDGKVTAEFRHRHAGERPDYGELAGTAG